MCAQCSLRCSGRSPTEDAGGAVHGDQLVVLLSNIRNTLGEKVSIRAV